MNLMRALLSLVVAYESVPVKNKSAVIHSGHPAIIDTALLEDATAKLKAGTILKFNSTGDKLVPAVGNPPPPANNDPPTPVDTPAAVLAEDSDGKNAEVLVCWHGAVVAGRLLDSSGNQPVAASEELVFNLRSAGIYPLQLFTSARKG